MMNHRAGFSDPKSSDGAGINLTVDPEFWEQAFGREAFQSVAAGASKSKKQKAAPAADGDKFAVVATFVPETEEYSAIYRERLERRLADEGLTVAAERSVPMNRGAFGVVAMTQQLPIQQLLVLRPESMNKADFGRALLRFQTRADFETLSKPDGEKKPSIISAEPGGNVIYKALMAPSDLALAFPDLQNPLFRASQGLVHDRFCTNAPKGLDKIQPLMCISNNGEMNNLSQLYQLMANDADFRKFLGLDSRSMEGTTAPVNLWDETVTGRVPLSDSCVCVVQSLLPPLWQRPPIVAVLTFTCCLLFTCGFFLSFGKVSSQRLPSVFVGAPSATTHVA